MVQEVCYVDIDVWGAQAESCRQYLQKGRAVLVEGRLKFDTWEDPQGQMRNKHSIVADRVVFLPASGSAEFAAAERTDKETSTTKSSADVQLEQELLNQIEQIKNRAQAQKKETNKEKNSVKEQPAKEEEAAAPQQKQEDDDEDQVAFKDTPPFEDELPF